MTTASSTDADLDSWQAPPSPRTPIHLVHVGAGATDGLAWSEAVRRARTAGALLVAVRVLPEVGLRSAYAAAAAELAQRIEASKREISATSVVTRGDVPHAISRIAWHVGAELIVTSLDVASVSEVCDLIPRVQVPVLVVREAPESGVIVGGTDLSDPYLPVVAASVTEARARRPGIAYVAHAIEPVTALHGCHRLPDIADDVLGDALMCARTRVRDALRAYPHVRPVVIDGPPARSLVDLGARMEAELIVVGTVGRRGLRRWLFGNVAEDVVREAPCSVFVVRLQRDRFFRA